MSRPEKKMPHSKTRALIIAATHERPLTKSKIFEATGAYSTTPRCKVKTMVDQLLREGILVMDGNLYLSGYAPAGVPIAIYP